MEAPRLITLTTDFGADSCFVGIMKGVIKGIAPSAQIVDLCHTIKPGNIREAAFLISKSWRYFPERSIHVVVVDPGVGTERNIIILEKGRTIFMAPDNGVLSYVMDDADRCFVVDEDTYWLKPVSRTFHGRDVFAPVAAFLAKGVSILSLASHISHVKRLPELVVKTKNSKVIGEIVAEDSFGNLITSIEERHLKGKRIERVFVDEVEVYGPVESFEEGRGKGLSCIIDSFGHLEIFVYLGSASSVLPEWDKKRVVVELS